MNITCLDPKKDMNNPNLNALLDRVLGASVLKDFSLLAFIGLIALVYNELLQA